MTLMVTAISALRLELSVAMTVTEYSGTWTTDVTPGGLPGSAHFSRLIGSANTDSTPHST